MVLIHQLFLWKPNKYRLRLERVLSWMKRLTPFDFASLLQAARMTKIMKIGKILIIPFKIEIL